MRFCSSALLVVLLVILRTHAQRGPRQLRISPAHPPLAQNNTQQLSALLGFFSGSQQVNGEKDLTHSVTWSSSDPTIVSVSSSGLAKAISSGPAKATITAASGPFHASTTVSVPSAALTSITLAPNPVSLASGLTQQFTATAHYADSTQLDISTIAGWSSSSTPVGITTVNATGFVKTHGPGSATISISYGGFTDSASLTVTTAVLTQILVIPESTSLNLGLSQQYTALGIFTDGSSQDFTGSAAWSSSSADVASITTGGLVSALKPGVSTIKAVHNGMTGSTGILVSAPGIIATNSGFALPFRSLTITGGVFSANTTIAVNFFDNVNYAVQVPPTDISANSITVTVPPFFDSNGNLTSSNVNLQVLVTTSAGTFGSNPIAGFQIGDLSTPATPGAATLDYLTGTRDLALSLRSKIVGSSLETPTLDTAISNQISNLDSLIAQVSSVVSGVAGNFNLGSLGTANLNISGDDLLKVDRMLIGVLSAQGAGGSPFTAARNLARWPLPLAQGNACASQEADAYTNALLHPDGTTTARDAYFNAYTNCIPDAFNTSYKVIGGSGAVLLAIMVLADAPAIAIALPSAALLYAVIEGSGGEIALGGALGQSSAAAVALIQDGVQRIEELKYALLKPILVELLGPVGPLTALIAGAHSLVSAFLGGGGGTLLTWSLSGTVIINGQSNNLSGTAVIPLAGGSAGFTSPPASITATVIGSVFLVSGSGFGSAPGGSCAGGGGGSSGIVTNPTNYSAGGGIGGNLHCIFDDGSSQDFPITGSFNASAPQ
jgi:hypothetical protein